MAGEIGSSTLVIVPTNKKKEVTNNRNEIENLVFIRVCERIFLKRVRDSHLVNLMEIL